MDNKSAIIDTNILIMICRSKSDTDLFLESKGILYSYITPLSYFEFLGGAKANQKRWAEKFLRKFSIMPFSKESNIISKTLCTQNEIGKGKLIDMLIASIGIANKIPIITANIVDFNFKGLDVIKYLIEV